MLSEYELSTGISLCFNKAERIADDADLILKHNGSPSHALVLYEFALEEYGKGELLRDCKSERNASGKYDVNKSIFKSHQKTTKRALVSLPEDCKKIDLGISVSTAFDKSISIQKNAKRKSSHRNIADSNNTILSIPPYLTGLFTTVGLHIEIDKVNLEKHVRWPALYVDWDNESKTWRHEFIPDVNRLSNAISSFRKHLHQCQNNADRRK